MGSSVETRPASTLWDRLRLAFGGRNMPVTVYLVLVLGALVAAFVPNPRHTAPGDQVVSARSALDLSMWRSRHALEHSPVEWSEFDEALLELRYRITAGYEATGSEAVAQAMCQRIDGLPYRRVIQLGYEARLARLADDKAQLESFLAVNATLRTRPDDEPSIAYLRSLRERQLIHLAELDREIAETQAKVAAR